MNTHQRRGQSNEYLDPDDIGLHNSPPLTPLRVNLQPPPSPPPAVPLPQVRPDSSPSPSDHKGLNGTKYRPNPGDAILLSYLPGGKYSHIARDAVDEPLASENEKRAEPIKGTEVEIPVVNDKNEPISGFDSLAADALMQIAKGPSEPAPKESTSGSAIPRLAMPSEGEAFSGDGENDDPESDVVPEMPATTPLASGRGIQGKSTSKDESLEEMEHQKSQMRSAPQNQNVSPKFEPGFVIPEESIPSSQRLRAGWYSAEEWNMHRNTIEDMYLGKGMKLKEIQSFLREHRDFVTR
jgi:hypothetical protein